MWSRIEKLSGWRSTDREYSFVKGAAIHMIDLICWLIEDRPKYVYASGKDLGSKETKKKDSSVLLNLEFENNLYVQVNALGPTIYPHYHELKIFGSNSTSIIQYKNNFFINKKNKKIIKNKSLYPDHKNKKHIIKNLVNSTFKNNFSLNKNIFDTMYVLLLKNQL